MRGMQADTILMGYPALDQLPEQVRRNDLEYYEEVTDINGPAMSWGMFAIGWLEVGEYQLAAKYFNQSYQYGGPPLPVSITFIPFSSRHDMTRTTHA